MNIKKIVALFISLVLVFSVCVVNVSAIDVSTEEILSDVIYADKYAGAESYVPGLLSENTASDNKLVDSKEQREYLFNAIYGGQAKIDVSKFGILWENRSHISNLIFYNMPEIFHINKISFSGVSGIVTSITPYYECTTEEYRVMYNAFEAAVKDVTRDVKTDNLSDVQKALILHDRLAIMCEYATDRLNSNTLTYKDYSAYGALVEGLAVCDGYTKAYEYLLEMVGIESKRCTSDEMNHAWNIVYIDGKAYHVDVTWDDPVFSNPSSKPKDYVRHTNFLLSSNALHNNTENDKDVGCHTSEDFDHEPDDTTYDHYFWRDCTHETLLIGSGLYHLNGAGALCEYESDNSLITSGLGDIDGDEKINAMDISHCRRFLTEKVTPQEKEFTACDLTKDGEISVSDLVRYKKILLYME